MNQFNVLTPTNNLNEANVLIAIKAFSNFYHDLTPKHQGKVMITFLTDSPATQKYALEQSKVYEIKDVVKIASVTTEKGYKEAFLHANVALILGTKSIKELLYMAYEATVPVVGIDSLDLCKMIDYTCGMIIEDDKSDDIVGELTRIFDTLYFDPDGVGILKKGIATKARGVLQMSR